MQIYRDENGNPIERGSGEPPQNVHLHAVAAANHAAQLAESFRDRTKALLDDAVKVADYARAAHKAIMESTGKNPDALAAKEREAERVEAENAKNAEEQRLKDEAQAERPAPKTAAQEFAEEDQRRAADRQSRSRAGVKPVPEPTFDD